MPVASAATAHGPASPTASALRIQIPSDTRFLHLITNFARNVAKAGGLSDPDADQLGLATDEAVTNVIKHAYHGRKGEPIEIVAQIHAEGVEIHVIHQGDPLKESALPPDYDPQQLLRSGRKGGLGVILMRRLVDRVDFRPTPDQRNECCLWKGKDDARRR